MSKVAIQGNASGTGTFTIAAPNSNTDRTLTLPDEAGTVLTSASGLTSAGRTGFFAQLSSNQLVNDNTATLIQFGSEIWDSHGFYDNTTNYRFQPSTAGFYFVWASLNGNQGDNYNVSVNVRKNGTIVFGATINPFSGTLFSQTVVTNGIVYLNGTDYIDAIGRIDDASGNSPSFVVNDQHAEKQTGFGAFLVG